MTCKLYSRLAAACGLLLLASAAFALRPARTDTVTVQGKVAALDAKGGGFELAPPPGDESRGKPVSVQVVTGPDTRWRKGSAEAKAADLAPGAEVTVSGTVDAERRLLAVEVVIAPAAEAR